MSSYPPPGIGDRFEEAMDRIEFELRQAIAYVNSAVVPQVRAESITAMRKVADSLRTLADRIEQRKGPQS
ncbi:MAG: hypothetical protein P4L40_19340 [Terracidiphilus sp.]|nr:hypothetical protein [Terracidiphilus sp.]